MSQGVANLNISAFFNPEALYRFRLFQNSVYKQALSIYHQVTWTFILILSLNL